jgi:hypothetical protein
VVEGDGGQFSLHLVDAEYEAATEAAREFGRDGQFLEGRLCQLAASETKRWQVWQSLRGQSTNF